MEIKSAEEILNKWYKPLNKIGDIASIQLTEAMKEYAGQFIDLTYEKGLSDGRRKSGGWEVNQKKSILSLKQLIK